MIKRFFQTKFIFQNYVKAHFSQQTISINPTQAKHVIDKPQKNNEKVLQGMNDYKQGLEFFSNGNYRISHEYFKRVMSTIKKNGMEDTESYLVLLKKLVLNQNHLRLYSDSEKTLEQIIDISQKIQTNEIMIYKEYNNLFLHCLRTNLNKAILLGKALLSEQEKAKIPIAYQKLFIFNLGTAYLLKGNMTDAKQRLRECLIQEPNTQLKGFALNNLAVASWWHKHPNFRNEDDSNTQQGNLQSNDHSVKENDNISVSNSSRQEQIQEDNQYSPEQIDKDFENVIPLLKRSIYNLENVDKIKDMEIKNKLKILLDQERLVPQEFQKFDPTIQMLLSTKESGIPVINIQEFLFNTDPNKRNEATFWFKYALKFFETVDPSNIDRCLITMALFCTSSHQFDKAEKLFLKVLEMLEGSDSFNKVLCLQLYGNLLKKNADRYKEGENFIAQAYSLSDDLPFWSNKLVHVSLPELDIF